MQEEQTGFNTKTAFLIIFWIIVVSVFVSVAIKFLNISKPYNGLFNYVLSFGVSYLIAKKIYQRKIENYKVDFTKNYFALIPFLIPLPILLQFGITSHIVHIIQMPDFVKKIFYELGSDYSWQTLTVVLILAPILEELICRGILLKGLLKRYSPIYAIIISSLLFGIMHLNPWQFIGAFGIGIINGWVFWKTQNIVLPILIHLANNLFFTIFGFYYGGSYLVEKPMREVFGDFNNQIMAIIFSWILMATIMFYLRKRFDRAQKLSTTTVHRQ